MHKKGIFTMYALIFCIILAGFIVFIFLNSQKINLKTTLGEPQLALVEFYSDAESELYFIDQTAKYSAYEALTNFYSHSGIDTSKGCINQQGYAILDFDQSNCDIKYSEEFLKYFDLAFKKRLKKANLNYQFTLSTEPGFIVGSSNQDLIYQKDIVNTKVKFTKPLQFKLDFDIDLSNYDKLIEEIRNNKPCLLGANIDNCLAPNPNFQINSQKTGDFINFEITSTKDVYLIDSNDQLQLDKPTIKFQVDLSKQWQTAWWGTSSSISSLQSSQFNSGTISGTSIWLGI